VKAALLTRSAGGGKRHNIGELWIQSHSKESCWHCGWWVHWQDAAQPKNVHLLAVWPEPEPWVDCEESVHSARVPHPAAVVESATSRGYGWPARCEMNQELLNRIAEPKRWGDILSSHYRCPGQNPVNQYRIFLYDVCPPTNAEVKNPSTVYGSYNRQYSLKI
jgi:hypothetical protein